MAVELGWEQGLDGLPDDIHDLGSSARMMVSTLHSFDLLAAPEIKTRQPADGGWVTYTRDSGGHNLFREIERVLG